MAIVHTRLKVLSRSTRSTVAALAYRSGTELVDQETGEIHNYLHKSVAGVELLLPNDAPESWKDLQELIKKDKHEGVQKLSNIAESHEKRKDAQVYREYEFALPRELTDAENKTLTREFVQDQICGLGMAAKLNFHFDVDEEGNRFPHVHVVMLTRRLEQNGLSRLKEREWNKKEFAKDLRFQFCEYANFHFKQKGIDIILDPRSYAEQGIALEPQVKIGKNVSEMESRLGKSSTDRVKDYNEVKLSNQFTILKNPQVVIDEITSKQTTFTERDIHKVLNRYVDDRDLHQKLVGEVKSLKSVIELNPDSTSNKHSLYTTKALIQNEQRFLTMLTNLQQETGHAVHESYVKREVESTNQTLSEKHNSSLSSDQLDALKSMVSKDRLVFIEGYAGSGKTTVVETAANIWKANGYNVVGLAPTNKAKEGIKGAGINAYTVHSFLSSYANNRQQFNKNTVLVLDEAGMVDLKRYTGLLNAVDELGVKLVSLGDRGQLTPVEAGCPFTMASYHYEFTKLTSIIRQRKAWQKEATQDFGNQNGVKGLQSYFENGNIKFADKIDSSDKRSNAKEALLKDWIAFRTENTDKNACILAHTNKDVADLNEHVRSHLRASGEIKEKEFTYTIEHMKEGKFGRTRTVSEERSFAVGDQIVFTGTNKGLGVHNGNIGRITALNKSKIQVDVDNKTVSFSPNLFKKFDLGWAMTVYKSQGATFDEGFVLGSRGLYANLTYVALTRHRDNARLYLSKNEFDHPQKALQWLTRKSDELIVSNVMTSDQITDGMKHNKEIFKDAYQATRNTLSALQYIGSRKLKEWTGYGADNTSSQSMISDVTKETVATNDSVRERNIDPQKEKDPAIEKQHIFTKMDRHEFSHFVGKINDSILGEDLAKDLLRTRGLNQKYSNSSKLRFGSKGSLQVTLDGDNANSWYDFERGEGGNLLKLIQREQNCDFKSSISYAAEYCRGSIRSEIDHFLEGKPVDKVSVQNIPLKDKTEAIESRLQQNNQKIADVKKLVEKSVPIEGSPADIYLRTERSIHGSLPDSLRYIPAKTQYTYDGKSKYIKSGAMISIAKSPEGKIQAVQLTYLTEDGTRSINSAGNKFAKITYGTSKGGYVTVQDDPKNQTFIVAEGVETALSIKEAGVKGKVVCSLGIGNYKSIVQNQKEVIIAADWDGSTEMPTYKAAEAVKSQVEAQGGKAHIVLPVDSMNRTEEKTDFNDILQKKDVASIKELLNNQAKHILNDSGKPFTHEHTLSRNEEKATNHKSDFSTKDATEMGQSQFVEKAPEQDFQEYVKKEEKAISKEAHAFSEKIYRMDSAIKGMQNRESLTSLLQTTEKNLSHLLHNVSDSIVSELKNSHPELANRIEHYKQYQENNIPSKEAHAFAEKIYHMDSAIKGMQNRESLTSLLQTTEKNLSHLLHNASDSIVSELKNSHPELANRIEHYKQHQENNLSKDNGRCR